MRRFTSLAWKEWHETRWIVAVGLGIFLGLPFIGMLQSRFAGYQNSSAEILPWVFALGGLMAIVVGTTITCRDFVGDLENFWRSRPVTLGQWMLVKYAIGLTIVLFICEIPLLVQAAMLHWADQESIDILGWYPFLMTAFFSLAFAAGVLLRRTGPASMFAVALMLLLYFLPFVLPPLQEISLSWVMSPPGGSHFVFDARRFPFFGAMLALSAGLLLIAFLSAKRDWQIRSGKKTMIWSIGAAVLLLVATTGFQVGSNLPLLQKVKLRDREYVTSIRTDGRVGIVFSRRWTHYPPSPEEIDGSGNEPIMRSLKITPAGMELGPIVAPESCGFQVARYMESRLAWSPQHPLVFYVLAYSYSEADPRTIPDDSPIPPGTVKDVLLTIAVDAALPDPVVDRKVLFEGKPEADPHATWNTALCISGERLFVLGQQNVTLDISDPIRPKVIAIEPRTAYNGAGRGTIFPLPKVSGLLPRDALNAMVRTRAAIDGNLMLAVSRKSGAEGNGLKVHRLHSLTDTHADFEEVGSYDWSFLERIFGYPDSSIDLGNGLGYVSAYGRVTIIDVARDPTHPKAIGHFAEPDSHIQLAKPLPDGRAIIGGNNLYLVGPPRKDP